MALGGMALPVQLKSELHGEHFRLGEAGCVEDFVGAVRTCHPV